MPENRTVAGLCVKLGIYEIYYPKLSIETRCVADVIDYFNVFKTVKSKAARNIYDERRKNFCLQLPLLPAVRTLWKAFRVSYTPSLRIKERLKMFTPSESTEHGGWGEPTSRRKNIWQEQRRDPLEQMGVNMAVGPASPLPARLMVREKWYWPVCVFVRLYMFVCMYFFFLCIYFF